MIPIVIQARLGSTRLPGKVLMPIGGSTVLGRVIERCRLARRAGEIVVATSDLASDDPLAEHARTLGVEVHRGSERDVLDRYIGAAERIGAGTVVRITADCPLLCPEVLDRVIELHDEALHDYSYIDGYPNGLGAAEALRVDALRRARAETKVTDEYWREHVMTYLTDHPDRFVLNVTPAPAGVERPEWRFSVDEQADLDVARAVWEVFAPRNDFSAAEIIAYCDRHPELPGANRHVKQKTH
jgi:spore coat polysaccharide biosynthesis protein SpsF (cytidylyltransferase family)